MSEGRRFGEGRMVRLVVVVRMSCAERDGGTIVVTCSRRSVVVASAGRANETVLGRERPGKVLRRTLILSGKSIATMMEELVLFDGTGEVQPTYVYGALFIVTAVWSNSQHFIVVCHVESRG